MGFLTLLLVLADGLLGLAVGYLLVLLLAAALRRRERSPREVGGERLRFVVLIPAHDEELTIGGSLLTLGHLEYPEDRREIIVIADNCADGTAEVARSAGATVWERADPSLRGKGYALAWALGRLRAERPGIDAVAVLDADCHATPNLLSAMEARLRRGYGAVQTDNVVGNPASSWSAALRFAGFAPINTVGPLGKSALGLSTGLRGTGMGISWAVLQRHPWESYSLAEDAEYSLRLLASGERIAFAPEAAVQSAMPTSFRNSHQQQLRYEGGKWQLIRAWTGQLIATGLRERNLARLHAGLELLVPPQALLMAGTLLLLSLAVALRSPVGVLLGAANLLGQVGYVLGGLVLVRAPAAVYRALALAPVLMLTKTWLYARVLAGRAPTNWVRTKRESMA